ncbi:MAG TPA: TPM domain-containing protein [Methylomirabilota bacterium]|nr:TPM domain-containing protein [Methylomirabilota bacterium]
MKTQEFIARIDDNQVSAAIAAAERTTSGEIRVFVSENAAPDPVAEAKTQFMKLGMEKTSQRNAVLLFFAPQSQTYAIVGDAGVDHLCGQEFWLEVTSQMRPLLHAGNYTEAIVHAVRMVGETLARNFPRRPDDQNELPDDVAR